MAKQRDADREHYKAASAVVTHTPSSKAWAYKDLALDAGSMTAPADLRLTDPGSFRLIGKAVPRVDIESKVDGSAKYGIDIWFPDMVFAAIKHCPTIGGTLASTPVKPSAALAVVPCTSLETRGYVKSKTVNAVAVVASNTWLAMRLARSLVVNWKLPTPTGDVDSAQILAKAQGLLANGPALVAEADPPGAAAPAAPTLDATYTLPYLAHATMEVLNCTVSITADGCEIWAPTQAASLVASNASTLTGLPAEKIKVHTTFLGGGLGRKFEQDYICQAIQVAMVVKKPVKLTWAREEDFAHDQYRPFALVKVKAKYDTTSKKISAWSYRNVSQAILGQRGWLPPGAVDSQAVEGAVRLDYEFGSRLVDWVPLPVGIPVGFWRSVGSSINAFAVESAIDELALAANTDPFEFRYSHLVNSAEDTQRFKAVLYAADMMTLSWRKTLPAGRAWGVAIAESFGTIVCEVVEVSAPVAGSMKVHRVACVVDCGTVINPDSVEAQMQGGILHALNATLWGQSTFTAGKANQQNFNAYRVMRISEMPDVTVQIVKSARPPSGVGEPGVPPLAPALANAYARLTTGKRVRTLPFFPGVRMGGI